MDIIAATASYEAWLDGQLTLIPADLERKHIKMAEDSFFFLGATFYRWMQLWPLVCGEFAGAPKVLAVGDLPIDNFGTWRDHEGRLIWGIRDFDEACVLPYMLDLVRLASSAYLAIGRGVLKLKDTQASDSILAGYKEGLRTGGMPLVLEEHHAQLRSMVTGTLGSPEVFWGELDSRPAVNTPLPAGAKCGIESMLPVKGLSYRVVGHAADISSLGRERYVAIAEYGGGKIAREAKAMAPSASQWADERPKHSPSRYQEIVNRAVRLADPFMKYKTPWLVRRFAPDCSRFKLTSLPEERNEIKLLYAMGFETANIHLGSKTRVQQIAKDLQKRSRHWLHAAAENMLKAFVTDWEQWRNHWQRSSAK